MKIQLLVTVTLGKMHEEDQDQKEFENEDGAAMFEYLSNKIDSSFEGAYQFNAKVDEVSVKEVN